MKATNDIFFSDPDFPLLIHPVRTSIIDDVNEAACAIHEAIEIKCFYEGESTLLIGDKTVHAQAGDVIVINPYEFHATVDFGGETTGKYHLFMLSVDFFSSIPAGIDLRHLIFGQQTYFATHHASDAELYSLLSNAAREADADTRESRLALFGLMSQVFAILLRRGIGQSAQLSADVAHYYSLIEPAVRMIRDGYSSKFTVEDLADACRISKYHFCRIFKTVMGVSAIQYLNTYRLKIAHTLLTNTDHRIGEVAALCGFEDTSYFCRIYKRHFGTTPKRK